jgi:multidrug efflux pump
MRIWLKPDRMAAHNISPLEVRRALAANNFIAAVGQTKGSLVQVNLTANTDLTSVGEFRRLVVRATRRCPGAPGRHRRRGVGLRGL